MPDRADTLAGIHRLCGLAELVERQGLAAAIEPTDLAGLSDTDRAAVTELLAEVERQLPAAAYRKAMELAS